MIPQEKAEKGSTPIMCKSKAQIKHRHLKKRLKLNTTGTRAKKCHQTHFNNFVKRSSLSNQGSYQLDFHIISPLMSVLTTLKHMKWFESQKQKISSKGSKDKQKFIFK